MCPMWWHKSKSLSDHLAYLLGKDTWLLGLTKNRFTFHVKGKTEIKPGSQKIPSAVKILRTGQTK